MADNKELFQSLIGSLCEIKTEDNDLLTVARVHSADAEDDSRLNFTSAQPDDRLPLLTFGMSVKVVCFSTGGFVLMQGTVYASGYGKLSLVKVFTTHEQERRRYFRLNVAAPAEVCLESDDDADSFSAQVLDISLGGIRLSTARELKVDDSLFVTFTLIGNKLEFFCQVRREIPVKENPHNLRQFGCQFIDCTTRQTDRLCSVIFQLQRTEIRRRKNM